MPIHKPKTKENFTTILNHTIQDKNLTFEASGLLHLMLSLPEDWEINKSWLLEQKAKCGRHKLTRMIKELVDFGYVVKKPKQNDDGKMIGIDWYVYAEPQLDLDNGLIPRPALKLHDGKPAPTKETKIQKIQDNKIDIPILKTNQYSDAFLELWLFKPPREGSNRKMAAYKAYKASLKRGHTHEQIKAGLMRYRYYCLIKNKFNTCFVMSMSRFFGEDEEFKNEWRVSNEPKANTTHHERTPTIEQIRQSREQYYEENQ